MEETRNEGNDPRNTGKEKVNEDQNHVSSSNNAQMKQKNKQVAEEPGMFDRNYPPFLGYEGSDFDFDYEDDFGYDYDSGFDYDSSFDYDSGFGYGFDFCDDVEIPDPWDSLSDMFMRYYKDEAESGQEYSDDYTYLKAIPQKEEDELIEKPMNIGVMSIFPSDVVFDIISRLPIKTLARCRCVCKDLCRLTHIRRFIKMHHDRAIQGDIPPSLLLHARHWMDELGCDIYSLQHDTRDDTLDGRAVIAHSRFSTGKKDIEFVGSCNGLLCMCEAICNGPRFVCNPVTGEYIRLPKPDARTDFGIVSGFGYDEATNEYKVVRMLFHSIDLGYQSGTPSFKLEGEIYSLSLGEWRNIGDVPYPLRGKASTAFVNGALHWMTDDHGSLNVSDLIISFDLGREEFQVVPPPPCFAPGPQSHMLNLGVLGKCLCLFDYSTDKRLDIWVMKKYGVTESWTKEYVISRRDGGRVIPLRLMKNGELLMSYKGESLVIYDPARRRFKDIRIRGLPPYFEAITHVGSLFSLRNAVGLAKRDRYNLSFGEWCSNLFPIPAHESITYGDEQLSEHGLKPSGGDGENLQCFKMPEEQDKYQMEEVASGADKMVDDLDAFLNLFDKRMNSYMESRGILARGESWERGRGGGDVSGSGGGGGNGRRRGKGRGRGRGWGRGRGGRSGRGGEIGSGNGNGSEGGKGGGSQSGTGTRNGNGRGRGRGTFVWRVKECKT